MDLETRKIPKGAIRVPLPDTDQDEDYTCGAASLLAICLYYGVGPVEEQIVARDSGMTKNGANPEDLRRAARKYGLRTKSTHPMSIDKLRRTIDDGIPVLCMLQAWKERPVKRYQKIWKEGHWVVAIGYDKEVIYFEDPSLLEFRGFLTYDEMKDRWHDIGKGRFHIPGFGMAVWHDKEKPKGRHVPRACHIG